MDHSDLTSILVGLAPPTAFGTRDFCFQVTSRSCSIDDSAGVHGQCLSPIISGCSDLKAGECHMSHAFVGLCDCTARTHGSNLST